MVRVVGATSVLVALALTAGCTSSHAEPAAPPVPIASVTEIAAFGEGWVLSVQVDDFRGCPTAFAVKADESADEIRLTASAFKGENHECGKIPTVSLESPVGTRRIVDASRGVATNSQTGDPLKDACQAVPDHCLVVYTERPQGRTFSFDLAPPAANP
jgi:hypothetical protein